MNKKPAKSKFLRFFQTPLGRRAVFIAASSTTLGLFAANFLPNTLGLKHYQGFVQCYKSGIPRKVPEEVVRRLERAFDVLELRPYERKIIKPFMVYGFDLFQAGSTKYRFGAILGVPVNYSYTSGDQMQLGEIRFRNEQIKWDSESGRMLREAIVLTEDEQVFGLCKSILQLQTHRVLLNSIFPSVSFLMVYTIGNFLNHRLNLFARPFSMRLVMYSILGLFGLGSWSFMKDYNQVLYDTDIDKRLSALGPRFVEAGVSYYDKMLKKNMALRALIGDDTYTARGNENFMLRHKTMPITLRKSFFEDKWKTLNENVENPTEIAQ